MLRSPASNTVIGAPIIGGTDKRILFNNAGVVGEANVWVESSNVLAQRNGTIAQSKLIYRTYTDASNYERLFVGADHAGTGITGFGIFVEKAGTGSDRPLYFGTTGTGSLSFVTNNNARWTMSSAGHFAANTDNAYDIGTSASAGRPRQVYVGSNVYAAAFILSRSGTSYASIFDDGDGNIRLYNGAANNFGMLKFGGTTSSFPALKRSTTYIQAKLADDSAYAFLMGKLTTDTAYSAGAPAATGYITMYDSNGTAVRVLCANP